MAGTTPTVALVGNPNTGKTTLFNALTGLSQRIGNYPGVTVERKSGTVTLADDARVDLVDLPGTYSLAAASPDEQIVVDVLLDGDGHRRIDAVLAIVDAGNLRRNLYLVSQLVEVGRPVVVALNMIDVARARGIHIDAQRLSRRLGVPVVPVCAPRREGIEALRAALATALATPATPPRTVSLPTSLTEPVRRLLQMQAGRPGDARLSPPEALRGLTDEGGAAETRLLERGGPHLAAALADLRATAGARTSLAALESSARYEWIDQVLAGCVAQEGDLRVSGSDRVDRLLTHRVYGLAIFIGISALLFQGIYTWSTPVMDLIEAFFGVLGTAVGGRLPPGALRSLLVDGVVAGVGSVLVFLPQIGLLFLLISLLEDCGYMARAALLMDRLLGHLGLSGRSFIPLLSSFACAVPGIMAARTISDRRDRVVTILVAPLMSCSARLPVYVLFIAAFVPDRAVMGGTVGLQGLTLLGMYAIGTLVAIPVALLLRRTVLRGDSSPFLLELPAYQWPTPRTVGIRVYQSCRAFVVRAGSVILAATVFMWALAYFPHDEAVDATFAPRRTALESLDSAPREAALRHLDAAEAAAYLEASWLGRTGHWVQPVFEPLGWDWRIGVAALASFPAREVVISALGTIFSLGGDQDETSGQLRRGLQRATRADGSPVFTLSVALSVMVFFALCAQCMSTLAVIRREAGSWWWPALVFAYMTALAYAAAFGVHRLGVGLGW